MVYAILTALKLIIVPNVGEFPEKVGVMFKYNVDDVVFK
jgi:hypothetical protein